ncbi:hypothetical protein ACRW9N_10965 [Listeria aquatica]|uniref:hypothetical protein n=1 Tax=Listeria aquatica TaxID=1494960 RepID=UPI003EF6C891
MALTQRSKDIWTLLFSILSFFIPFGMIISIPTWIISNKSISVEGNAINRSTKVLSVISTVLSVLVVTFAVVGFMTYFQSK